MFIVGIFMACLFAALGHPVHAATGINKQLNYQARLLNNQGAVVPDGTYNVEFKIYQDGTGCVSSGTSPCGGTLKWTETRTGSNKVTVKNGYFSVALGSVTAFGTSVDWNQDSLWLSINVGGTGTPTWDGEMLPFRQLAASPYAMNAGQLGGLDASKFLQIAPSAVQVDSGTLSSIYLNKTGASGNILQLQKNGTDAMVLTNDGKLALGSTTPTGKFEVQNGANVLFGVSTTGSTTIKTTTDATNAFQVLSNGGAAALNVDTVNSRVGVGGVITPATALDVTGAIQQTGMTTLNTTNVDNNKWVKLGTCTITFQYQQCLTTLKIMGGQDGTLGDFPYATVNARVKQQDPLTNAPLVDLTLDANAKVITSADIKTVTTQNDATATVVSLYGRITNQYDQWAYTPVMNTGRTATAPWMWTPSDAFQAALPAGTQTAATYANIYGTAIQGSTSVSTASLRPITDDLSALKLQSTDASVTALTADTFNGRVAIGGDFGATEALDVKGAFQVRDAITMTKSLRVRTSGSAIDMETSGSNLVFSTWSGASYTGTQYNQITFKSNGSNMDFARGFSVSDAAGKVGLGGNVNPLYPLDVTGDINTSTQYRIGGTTVICVAAGCTPAAGSTNYIQNSATVQSANLFVQAASSGSVAGVLQANAAGAGAIMQLKDGTGTNVAIVGSAGATTFQNSTNSTAGFQILAAAGGGGNTVLRVDTTNERVAIGVISDPIGAKLSVATSSTVALRAYQGSASDTFQLGNATADFLTVSSTGNLLLKPTTASAAALQVQIAGTSTNVFNVDTSGLAVNIGTSDTSGTLLVLDTKTGSGDPTGTNGAMYYNSNAGVFRCYEGSAWVDCISKHIKALGSDVANSTTTIADATGLSFTVASGRTYRFHAQIAYSSAATTTGVKWAANGPTNSLFAFVAETTNGAGAQSQCYLNVVNTLCATASTTSLTTGNTAIIDGTITTTASGTVIVRFASGVAASAITIKTGSTIEWW